MTLEVRAARLAGGLIAITGVVGLALTVFDRWPALGPDMPFRLVRLGIDLFLAVPLLRGNRRFRWLAVIVACIGIPSAIMKRIGPDLSAPGSDP
jgi:hypothetical protein